MQCGPPYSPAAGLLLRQALRKAVPLVAAAIPQVTDRAVNCTLTGRGGPYLSPAPYPGRRAAAHRACARRARARLRVRRGGARGVRARACAPAPHGWERGRAEQSLHARPRPRADLRPHVWLVLGAARGPRADVCAAGGAGAGSWTRPSWSCSGRASGGRRPRLCRVRCRRAARSWGAARFDWRAGDHVEQLTESERRLRSEHAVEFVQRRQTWTAVESS